MSEVVEYQGDDGGIVGDLRTFMTSTYASALKKSVSEAGNQLVAWMISRRIRLLATDFDCTMTTRHSGGHIDPKVDTRGILTSISKDFNEFATSVCSKGIPIVCATFSDKNTILTDSSRIAGERLVEATMLHSSVTFKIAKVYGFWPENYVTTEGYSRIGLRAPMPQFKTYHLSKACEDFEVSPSEVLFIDDDVANCCQASIEGYPSLTIVRGKGFGFKDLSTVV